MTNSLSIDPPIELMREWARFQGDTDPEALWFRIAREAAQWGADAELEACCLLLDKFPHDGPMLHDARRPKPPSLKEQACDALDAYVYGNPDHNDKQNTYNIIRRALEALPND